MSSPHEEHTLNEQTLNLPIFENLAMESKPYNGARPKRPLPENTNRNKKQDMLPLSENTNKNEKQDRFSALTPDEKKQCKLKTYSVRCFFIKKRTEF